MNKGDLVIDIFNQIGIVTVVEKDKPWGNDIYFKLLKDGAFDKKGETIGINPKNLKLLLTKEELKPLHKIIKG